MPRNGANIYSKPAGTTAVAGATIESAKFNSTIDDLVADANAARPIVAGGTGATSASAARTALGFASTAHLYNKKGADVASATALTLGDDGNYFDITGTTAITSIATKGVGTVVKLHFDASLTLTHHATDLILPGGANIVTAAGDEAEFIEYATGDWRCTNYSRASENWVDVASATTTDIGAAASQNVRITGTTTITGLGTVAAGTFRRVRFAGILTLTHNGTSLILPGAANITTAAGDVFELISEGSGNWRCVDYTPAAGSPILTPWVAYTPTFVGLGTVTSINIRSRRVGSNLEVRGTFTCGTTTVTTATITLGFGGTNGGLSVASTATPIEVAGAAAQAPQTGGLSLYILALASDAVMKIGYQGGSVSGLTPAAGNVLSSSSNVSIQASIPIQGW